MRRKYIENYSHSRVREKYIHVHQSKERSTGVIENFDGLEWYFDDAKVDRVEQEYNHKQIYCRYSREQRKGCFDERVWR